VVSVALVSPLAGFAQVAGSVTTDPIRLAPALAMPMLVVLAIALIGFGVHTLRTRSAKTLAGVALVAGLSLLAGFSYATNGGIFVQGPQCDTQTTQPYPSLYGETLTSLCPNPIRIVALDACGVESQVFGDALPDCTVGEVLTNGQGCYLPICK
jgi:hypothetical protein